MKVKDRIWNHNSLTVLLVAIVTETKLYEWIGRNIEDYETEE